MMLHNGNDEREARQGQTATERKNANKSEETANNKDREENMKTNDIRDEEMKEVEKLSKNVDQGVCKEEEEQKVQTGWRKWSEVRRVVCNKIIPKKFKMKIYGVLVRPVLTYGAETWPLRIKETERNLKRSEMSMLVWAMKSIKEHLTKNR